MWQQKICCYGKSVVSTFSAIEYNGDYDLVLNFRFEKLYSFTTMAFLIQEVPDPKESLGCGSIILIIIGVIVGIFYFAGSESNNKKSKPAPAEIKTEQIQQIDADVKRPVSSTPQTNSQQEEKKTSVPATSTNRQGKTTVSPVKGTTTVNSTRRTIPEKKVTKNTSDTLTTPNKQTKSLSEPVKTGTSVSTDKERRKAERQARKEARQKEKARKK